MNIELKDRPEEKRMGQTDRSAPLDEETVNQLTKVANTIRHLSIDGVQKANSGHPGLPLGCAEIGAYLYGKLLKHNPKNPQWINRDRFILSAGHGSMFLYSCLHLAGFDLPMEEVKSFRQWNSKTPGHPESHETPGVETTTGPLGQGVGNAVGQALGLKMLGAKFNSDHYTLIDSKVYCLAGDGCIMEGISSEVCSLAGHLNLNNLVLIYDSNDITLDGALSDSYSEDTKMRFESYGWDVFEVDGHDLNELHATFSAIGENQKKPAIVIAKTIIGKGSPNKGGTHKVHGAPLGPEEVLATKRALGLPEEEFHVPQSVRKIFSKKLEKGDQEEKSWNTLFGKWCQDHPKKGEEWQKMHSKTLPEDIEQQLRSLEVPSPIAGRSASNAVINFLAATLPQIIGGSADLSCSDSTLIKNEGIVAPGQFNGRNIKYGVREFGMATMAIGLAQTHFYTPFIGTFFTFSDYMRNAIRLAALSKIPVIYQFTHDSILLGEDGPTHQPVEHLASLRAMPNLHLFRPCDTHEVKMSWLAALKYNGPSAIILSRQALPDCGGSEIPLSEGVGRGAYILKKESGETPDYTLFATGSEVSLALDVSVELEKRGKSVRVVSVPCWELFDLQDAEYRKSVVCGNLGKRVSIEAGVDMGWHRWIGHDGVAIAMESFGASAPGSVLASEFGFTIDSILERIL